MAKQNASDRPDPSPVGSHGLLRGLVEAVHHLIAMISARLSRSRIHQSPMGNAKGEYDIWKKIGNHVERISADTKPEGESRRNRSVKSSYPKRHEDIAVAAHDLSQLTEHSKRKAADRLLPSMNEQLQSKTMEHINISLILAKEGNPDGARLHVELAENAMHTASRFMSHEEYELFQQKVERRLKSIVDRGDSDTSGM